MSDLHIRWMKPEEVSKIAQIDRSEVIRTGYVQQGDQLQKLEVNWDSPTFSIEGEDEHSVAGQTRFCQSHLDRGGRMIGAFDGDRLAGIGVVTPEIRPRLAQLAYLHVSRPYRRQGIAGQLAEEMIAAARASGARQMVVSAVPSGSAVGFYSQLGFKLMETPLPELFELEPEDIHMMMDC